MPTHTTNPVPTRPTQTETPSPVWMQQLLDQYRNADIHPDVRMSGRHSDSKEITYCGPLLPSGVHAFVDELYPSGYAEHLTLEQEVDTRLASCLGDGCTVHDDSNLFETALEGGGDTSIQITSCKDCELTFRRCNLFTDCLDATEVIPRPMLPEEWQNDAAETIQELVRRGKARVADTTDSTSGRRSLTYTSTTQSKRGHPQTTTPVPLFEVSLYSHARSGLSALIDCTHADFNDLETKTITRGKNVEQRFTSCPLCFSTLMEVRLNDKAGMAEAGVRL